MKTHLDLFSGIGGFALAAEWAGLDTVLFCEIDPYCRKVLGKHWPDVPIHDDIRTLTGDLVGNVDLITGGFPCQPVSIAGKRRGESDDRWLWPEMRRLVADIRPDWVLAENPLGILTMGIDGVLADLEAQGYQVGTVVVPACAVGAWHRRDRVWIAAHAPGVRRRGRENDQGQPAAKRARVTADDVDDAMRGRHGASPCAIRARRDGPLDPDWWSAEPGVDRMVHGIPHRVDRVRALGNSIVPQVAYELIAAMKEAAA